MVALSYRPPFDFEGLLKFYRSHRVGELEYFSEGKMRRVIHFNGKTGTVELSNDPAKSRVQVEIDFPDTSMIHVILARVRTLLDLDSDPLVIANSLEIDPKVKRLLKKHAGLRLPSGWDPFEVAVSAVLGQLVSVERGRCLVSDLIELLGDDSGLEQNGRAIRLFPTPAKIAASTLDGLKTTGMRKTTLIELSGAVASGALSLEPTQDVALFTEALLEIKGIGPWTASYMALKVLRHTDAFPETDLILARALELHSRDSLARMSPWRGYVATLFWREYSATLTKTRKI